MAAPGTHLDVPRLARLGGAIVAGAALLAGLTLATVLSGSRELQVDEIEHVHAAYSVAQGGVLYADFWQGHHPAIYAVLAPLIDADDPAASFARARRLMWLLWLGSLGLAAFCALRLSGRGEAALLAAGLLALHSTFVERGLEIRPDGWLALLGLGALALELAPGARGPRRLAQALVLALAFLFTKKAALPCAAFGVLWLTDALRERSPWPLLLPCAVWAAPVAATVAWMVGQGSLDEFVLYNVRNQAQLVARTALEHTSFGPWRFVASEGSRNLLFGVLGVSGLAASAALLLRRRAPRPLVVATWLCAVMLSALWLAPQPFPYLHVSILPFVALLGAWALVAATDRAGLAGARMPAVALALLLAGATSLPRLHDRTRLTHDRQLAIVAELQRITEPHEPVFDLVGLYFRPDAYPVYLMTGIMFARYRAGGFPPISEALARSRPPAIVLNYRTRWLSGADGEFIRDHYVHYTDNIFVQGRRVDGLVPGRPVRFEVLRARPFRYRGDGRLLVDGEPFERGWLEPGGYVLEAGEPIGEGVIAVDPGPPAGGDAVPLPPRPLFTPFD